MNRRGVSPVIATVLLLVLTVVIGAVVFSFVIPFVNEKLGHSKDCLDVFESVEFPESKFNCYITSPDTKTAFSVKITKDTVKSVTVSLIDNVGGSKVYQIIQGVTSINGLTMVGGSTTIEFPSVGGQKSYVVNGLYEKAEISALTEGGEICSISDMVEFEPCSGVTL